MGVDGPAIWGGGVDEPAIGFCEQTLWGCRLGLGRNGIGIRIRDFVVEGVRVRDLRFVEIR